MIKPKTSLKTRSTIATLFLAAILTAGIAIGSFNFTMAQDSVILGYPYNTSMAGGDGAQYAAVGSLFTLNGEADISSMSCLFSNHGSSCNFRFAIYRDNGGSVGALVNQTAISVLPNCNEMWATISFAQPVHLSAGGYWLMIVRDTKQDFSVYKDLIPGTKLVSSHLGSISFPSTLPSATYTQNQVNCIYASGTGQSSPFPSPTPTISPTPNSTTPTSPPTPTPTTNGTLPTPNPTSSPTPTPNPSLPAPAITVSCVSSTSADAFRVQIQGSLTYHGYGMANSPVRISYSNTDGSSWQTLTSVSTASDGSFLAEWLPSVTGNYMIKASYAGNATMQGISATVMLVVSPPVSADAKDVFSVGSNSTVTNLAFNSENGQLSFTVSGPSQTTGFVDVCIAKATVSDITAVKAFIDGASISYTATSTNDSWILHFTYHHSTHEITLSLNGAEPGTPLDISQVMPLIVIAVAAVCVVGIILGVRRKYH